MSKLTIEEAKEEKRKLEKALTVLVREFHAKTGVAVKAVQVVHMERDDEIFDHLLRVVAAL